VNQHIGMNSVKFCNTAYSLSSNFFHKTHRYYCNQDGSSFPPSPNWGKWEGIWNRTVLYDPQN